MAHLYDTRNSEETHLGIYIPQILPLTFYWYFEEEITLLRHK